MAITPLTAFSSATAMVEALQRGEISSVELLDLHLRQIAEQNPTLNAIVTADFERALRTAEEADVARAHGDGRRLLGLPVTIKDCLDVEGLPTTAGDPKRAHAIAAKDGLVAARVRAAGTVIMGKTNVSLYAGDWHADNRLFGRTNNPWDRTRTPGGSTGGGAAAVAAGMTPLEFGGDLGGSIRVPAAFCGCYGHSPSGTALPRSGHFPGSPLPNPTLTMGVQGPLARSAADLELAVQAVAGPEIGEDTAWHITLPPARHERLKDYRVAMFPLFSWLPIDNDISEARENLAAHLRRLGATVKDAQPEAFGDGRAYYQLYFSLMAVVISLAMPAWKRRLAAAGTRLSREQFVAAWRRGLRASATDYVTWYARREKYREAYRLFFREWDVLLAPVCISNAFPHPNLSVPITRRTLDVNGHTVPYLRLNVYPSLATLCGQPATAFPVGQTRAGLPIGLQVIGPYLEDRTTLRFAHLLEQELGGFRRPPNCGDE
jgi:amidase